MMGTYQAVKYHNRIRTKIVGELGVVWPEIPQKILQEYISKSKNFGRDMVHFRVDGLPMSLNHQYKKGKSFKNKAGQSKVVFRLDPKVLDYRMRVCEALGPNRWKFKCTGAFAAVIFLESKLWITTERKVRQMDADNRVKGILDAIEQAMDLPDELCWNHHVFKVAAKRDRTTVYLFDLGDVVEVYY